MFFRSLEPAADDIFPSQDGVVVGSAGLSTIPIRFVLPPEIFGSIVRFIPSVRTFFSVLLLNKTIRNYIEREDSDCASHLLFTVRAVTSRSARLPAQSARRRELDIGPTRPRGRGYFVDDKPIVVPKDVPSEQLCAMNSLYPEIQQPHYRMFPRDGPTKPEKKEPAETPITPKTPLSPYVFRLRSRHRIESGRDFRNLLESFPNLQHAEFHNVIECTAAEFSALQKPLQTLDLQQCGISDVDFTCDALSSLTTLRIRACGESGALTLGLLQHLPKLLKLEVECILETFRWDVWQGINAHPLRKLVLSNVTLGEPLSNGEFADFKSLESLVLSRVSTVADGAFARLPESVRKLVVHLCDGISEDGVKAACGPTAVALMDECVVNVVPRWQYGLAGRIRGPSASQSAAVERAREERAEKLGRQFQLKHLVGERRRLF